MEKSTLTAFEEKCIQEEPPFCTAGCPLHVDVKSFLRQMAVKNFGKALKVLEKTLPLPDIVARVCDHPCEDACIRKTVDAPVAIGQLERLCICAVSKRKKRIPLPAKGKRVGIWGSGLSSLTAAWDLGMKGYDITVHDPSFKPGGDLFTLPASVLPETVIQEEILRLESFGVRFRIGADVGFEKKKALLTFDAVYLGFDCRPTRYSEIPLDKCGRPEVDSFLLQTMYPMIFAGGFSEAGEEPDTTSHPIAFAAQGRKAATSIDRFLSGVSMSAGREKEGCCATRLSTDISRVDSVPRTCPDTDTGFDIESASKEAARCIQCDCSRCIRACTYLESFKGYPGRYAREIYNNFAIVMGERKANRLINSCSLCGLCETVCPSDFSMADLCLSARREMVEKQNMPVSAHEFALQEMAHAAGKSCFFARHAPGTPSSDWIFFPGCPLSGSAPNQVEIVYAFLEKNLPGQTGFAAGCCGAPARWAGRESMVKETQAQLRLFWETSDRPVIITACTACALMLAENFKGAEITSLFTLLAGMIERLPGASAAGASGPVAVIDPCTARENDRVREDVRTLVKRAGLEISELQASGPLTECCGFGGPVFNANPDLSKKIIRQRAHQSPRDYLAYCAMCRDRLVATGKTVFHLLDLFWPASENPGLRRDPGFSRRHDNLGRMKVRMLDRVWHETASDAPGNSDREHLPRIHIPLKVAGRLDDQFILASDIRQVIIDFENNGPWFTSPDNQSVIAFSRPRNVCFWTEFRFENDGYHILDAWCHRMHSVSGQGFLPGRPDHDHDPHIECGPCHRPLEFYKSHMEYLGSRFEVVLPQCPDCGRIYISRNLARGKIAEVETILEDK